MLGATGSYSVQASVVTVRKCRCQIAQLPIFRKYQKCRLYLKYSSLLFATSSLKKKFCRRQADLLRGRQTLPGSCRVALSGMSGPLGPLPTIGRTSGGFGHPKCSTRSPSQAPPAWVQSGSGAICTRSTSDSGMATSKGRVSENLWFAMTSAGAERTW